MCNYIDRQASHNTSLKLDSDKKQLGDGEREKESFVSERANELQNGRVGVLLN